MAERNIDHKFNIHSSYSKLNIINPYRFGSTPPPTGGLDSDVQAVVDLATTNGYTIPEQYKLDALSTFVESLKSTGEYDKMDLLEVFAYGDTEAVNFSKICIVRKKVISPVGSVVYTPYGFEGNGTNAYINNEFSFYIDSVNYARTSANRGCVMYKQPTTGSVLEGAINSFRNMSQAISSVNQRVNSSNNSAAVDLSGVGFKCLSRLNDTNVNLYNKSVKTTTNSISASISENNFVGPDYTLFRVNTNYSNAGISLNFLGGGLIDAEVANIRAYFNTFLMSVGLNQIA